jgi:predicted dehydrogenase
MIKCAIVGCGQIAGGYDVPDSDQVRTHAKAFLRHPDCQLVGVCDVSEKKASDFAVVWSSPFSTTDFKKLLSKCKPDLLSICSPTETHLQFFEQACVSGVSVIWMEKPAAESSAQVIEMLRLVKKYKVSVWVNYIRRYDVGFRKLKKKLDDGVIGTLQYVGAFYTKGFRHNGSHMINLIYWLFGSIKEFQLSGLIDDSIYPSISATLRTEVVAINLVALNYKYYELFELDIIGSKGRIIVKDGGQVILFESTVENKFYSGYKNLSFDEKHDYSFGQCMGTGLNQGLSGYEMPSLDDELLLQRMIDEIECASHLKNRK